MLNKLKKYHSIIYILIVYYLPFFTFVKDTGSAILTLFFIIPVTVLIVFFLFAKKYGFNIYYSLAITLLWLLNIFILNDSAAIYALIYGALSIIGQLAGFMLNRLYKN